MRGKSTFFVPEIRKQNISWRCFNTARGRQRRRGAEGAHQLRVGERDRYLRIPARGWIRTNSNPALPAAHCAPAGSASSPAEGVCASATRRGRERKGGQEREAGRDLAGRPGRGYCYDEGPGLLSAARRLLGGPVRRAGRLTGRSSARVPRRAKFQLQSAAVRVGCGAFERPG